MSRKQNVHQPLGFGFEEVLTSIADENKPTKQTLAARPFLKWVGGKRSVLPELLSRMPEKYGTYNEPFLGGGALYFAIQPSKAYLSDINFHLIITFQAVRDDVEGVIKQLAIHERLHNKEYYLKARTKLFKEKEATKLAALFIYLNKTCYNGLYRVNKSGGFNVPMGNYKEPAILDEDNLYNCSKVLQNTEIVQQDFTQLNPTKGNFYYLDPPYHETYDGYNGNGFGDNEHIMLADFCHEIDKKGGFFMLSNSDTDFVKNLYKGYNIQEISASRSVSCKGHQRGKANELVIRNYGEAASHTAANSGRQTGQ